MKIIFIVVLLTLGYLYGMSKLETMRLTDLAHIPTSSQNNGGSTITNPSTTIAVTISGAVVSSGKYTVNKGSSLADLLEKAGGVTSVADTNCYNTSYLINDLTAIYIASDNGGNKISLNTANVATLAILPGVGEIISQRIVDYRTSNGMFQCIDDIRKVNGIGDAIFAKVRELIRL